MRDLIVSRRIRAELIEEAVTGHTALDTVMELAAQGYSLHYIPNTQEEDRYPDVYEN